MDHTYIYGRICLEYMIMEERRTERTSIKDIFPEVQYSVSSLPLLDFPDLRIFLNVKNT